MSWEKNNILTLTRGDYRETQEVRVGDLCEHLTSGILVRDDRKSACAHIREASVYRDLIRFELNFVTHIGWRCRAAGSNVTGNGPVIAARTSHRINIDLPLSQNSKLALYTQCLPSRIRILGYRLCLCTSCLHYPSIGPQRQTSFVNNKKNCRL